MIPTITMLTDNRRGSFEINLDKEVVVKMTFVLAGTTDFIIDHTEVKHEHYGKLLIQKVIAFAKEKYLKLLLCVLLRKHTLTNAQNQVMY